MLCILFAFEMKILGSMNLFFPYRSRENKAGKGFGGFYCCKTQLDKKDNNRSDRVWPHHAISLHCLNQPSIWHLPCRSASRNIRPIQIAYEKSPQTFFARIVLSDVLPGQDLSSPNIGGKFHTELPKRSFQRLILAITCCQKQGAYDHMVATPVGSVVCNYWAWRSTQRGT